MSLFTIKLIIYLNFEFNLNSDSRSFADFRSHYTSLVGRMTAALRRCMSCRATRRDAWRIVLCTVHHINAHTHVAYAIVPTIGFEFRLRESAACRAETRQRTTTSTTDHHQRCAVSRSFRCVRHACSEDVRVVWQRARARIVTSCLGDHRADTTFSRPGCGGARSPGSGKQTGGTRHVDPPFSSPTTSWEEVSVVTQVVKFHFC